MGELLNADEQVFSELKNLCVWNKTNGGMGTFYRSKHELILVFKVGIAPHVNTLGIGETGRYRTNVWEYAGVNTFREGAPNACTASGQKANSGSHPVWSLARACRTHANR
jgi:hypothetical protein